MEQVLLRGGNCRPNIHIYGGADWFTISCKGLEDMFAFSEKEKGFSDLFVNPLSGGEIYDVSIFQMIKADNLFSSKNMLRYID